MVRAHPGNSDSPFLLIGARVMTANHHYTLRALSIRSSRTQIEESVFYVQSNPALPFSAFSAARLARLDACVAAQPGSGHRDALPGNRRADAALNRGLLRSSPLH